MSEINRQKIRQTLCWDCANATGGCPWSEKFKPVKGWTIIPTKIKASGNTDSCIVISCPLFVRNSERYGQQRLRKGDHIEKQCADTLPDTKRSNKPKNGKRRYNKTKKRERGKK